MFKKVSLLAFAIVISISLPRSARAVPIYMDLNPTNLPCNSSICYLGHNGMFLGDNYQTQYNTPANNFTFRDMHLTIDSITGNALVQGTMSNDAVPTDIWSVNLALSGFSIVDNSGTPKFFDSNAPYKDMVEDIIAIPANYSNQAYGQGGYGINWANADLNLTHLGTANVYTGPTSLVGWLGNHGASAMLHNWNGYLYFTSWFGALDNPTLNRGDSKAYASNLHYGSTEIPEPATLTLLWSGGVLFLCRRRRKPELM